MITTWKSHAQPFTAMMLALDWKPYPEEPSIYHTVHLAFATRDGVTYRRLTFPDGTHMYSRLEYAKGH